MLFSPFSCRPSYKVVVFIFLWHSGSKCDPILSIVFLLVLSFVFVNVVFVSCPLSLTRPVAPFQERVENFCGRCCWSMPEFSTRPAVMYWLIKLAAVTERILGVVPRRYFFPLSVTTRKFAAPLFRFLWAAQVLLTVTLDLSLSELFTARNAASRWQLRLLNFCLCVCVPRNPSCPTASLLGGKIEVRKSDALARRR